MDENVLVFTDENGKEIECRILFTCTLEGFEDNQYVVFQIGDTEEISAARYVEEEGGEGQLFDVESEEEWKLLDDYLASYYDDLEEADE